MVTKMIKEELENSNMADITWEERDEGWIKTKYTGALGMIINPIKSWGLDPGTLGECWVPFYCN